MTRLAGLLLLLLAGCSASSPRACTLIGVDSGVLVDTTELPTGASGQVCLVAGPCVAVPADALPLVLALPDAPATAQVEVRLVGRPVERLAVTLQASYPNGRQCGPAGHQATVHLTAGATRVG